jgi:hypothetical protein
MDVYSFFILHKLGHPSSKLIRTAALWELFSIALYDSLDSDALKKTASVQLADEEGISSSGRTMSARCREDFVDPCWWRIPRLRDINLSHLGPGLQLQRPWSTWAAIIQ